MKNLIVLLALLIVVSVCLPAWDYVPPRPAKDISGIVVTLPDSVYREYGFSDRTTVYGNLNRILLALQVTQAEVLALKDRVKVLESQVRTLIEKESTDAPQGKRKLQEQARPQAASEKQEERP